MRTWIALLMLSVSSCRNGLSDGGRTSLTVCGKKVDVELKLTDASRSEGYMYRDEGPSGDRGMFFAFPDSKERHFWMANVKFPLDILFADESGNIVSVHTMDAAPNVSPAFQKRYPSGAPARYAVEMRRGWASEAGARPGCQIQVPTGLEVK